MHGSGRFRSRSAALGAHPALGHDSANSLQWLAQSNPVSSRGAPCHGCSSCSTRSPWQLTPGVSLSSRTSSPSGCPVFRSCTSTQTTPACTREAPKTHRSSGHQRKPPLRSKIQGLGLGNLSHLAGPDAATGVAFAEQGASVKHMGVPLPRSPLTLPKTSTQLLFTRWIARWSGFRLSLLAKQVLAEYVVKEVYSRHQDLNMRWVRCRSHAPSHLSRQHRRSAQRSPCHRGLLSVQGSSGWVSRHRCFVGGREGSQMHLLCGLDEHDERAAAAAQPAYGFGFGQRPGSPYPTPPTWLLLKQEHRHRGLTYGECCTLLTWTVVSA